MPTDRFVLSFSSITNSPICNEICFHFFDVMCRFSFPYCQACLTRKSFWSYFFLWKYLKMNTKLCLAYTNLKYNRLHHMCSPLFRHRSPVRTQSDWGNHNGHCLKLPSDCERKTPCNLRGIVPKKGHETSNEKNLSEVYSKQLEEIINRGKRSNLECNLYKHDVCHYQPSDKTRRYQRTWPECPMITLRPVPQCCYPKDYPAIPRRPPPPYKPPLTKQEMLIHEMKLLCKFSANLDNEVVKKCTTIRRHTNCKRDEAPSPSFTECKKENIEQFCPTECACKVKPNLCDIWNEFNRNTTRNKRCTDALVSYCPFKQRSRPLF